MDLVAGDFFAKDIVAMLLVEELTEMALSGLGGVIGDKSFLGVAQVGDQRLFVDGHFFSSSEVG